MTQRCERMPRFSIRLFLVCTWLTVAGASAQSPAIGDQAAERRAAGALSAVRQSADVPVFGSQLFAGTPARTRSAANETYVLQNGDRIAVRAFGAYSADLVGEIDQNGILFVPDVGPINLAGRRAGELQALVSQAVRRTFTENVRVYATLVTPGTIGVYTSGDVNRPGRYVGGSNDDLLFFLHASGGINTARGSFRDIRILRRGKIVAQVDLYRFLLDGELPVVGLQEGDVIFVSPRGALVAATGGVLAPFAYELPAATNGDALIDLARPKPGTNAVALSGTRMNRPFARYLAIEMFSMAELKDGDRVDFRSDLFGNEISVAVESTSNRAQAIYVVPRNATLAELLAIVPLDAAQSDISAIHVNRASVADQQREALLSSLRQLERDTLLQRSLSSESAEIQRSSAQNLATFIERAREAEPIGTISVVEGGVLANLTLEDGDVVVIPDQTDVVTIAGEVLSPGAFIANQNQTIGDLIARAGGYQSSANRGSFVVVKRSGVALRVGSGYTPEPGDRVLVLPRVGNPGYRFAKDITEVIFQLALSTATVARL